jgi:CRP-like cAMP-binding protein
MHRNGTSVAPIALMSVTAPLFVDGLAASDVRAVLAAATVRRFPARRLIYEEGSPASDFFLLSKGRARYFCTTPDGRKTLLHWMVPGDVLGVAALLTASSLYRVSAETVQDSSLLTWNRETMRALLDRYPRLSHNALVVASGYLDWYIAAHSALVSDTARQRLASVLDRIADVMGTQVPGGVELQVTNEELASAANITLFTTSRILNEWQTARALTKHRGRIVLHSPRRLFRLIA